MSLRGRIYPGAHGVGSTRQWFRWTGEKRAPRAGEYFLSGAIPEVYRASSDLDVPFHIMEQYEPAPGERIIDGEVYVRKVGQ